MTIVSIVLAAGAGTRMKSEQPKVLHPLVGRPLIDWALDASAEVSDAQPVVVTGHGREQLEAHLAGRARFVEQREQLGTGHAVLQAKELLAGAADAVVVTYGDMPLLRGETLAALTALFHQARTADRATALAMLTIVRSEPQGFGRIVRDELGRVQAIVEEADCTAEQLAITELNPGVYCFDAEWLWRNLPQLPVSRKGEYYLTDMIGLAVAQGRSVVTMQAAVEELGGVNTRVHLADAAAVLRRRILERHMLAGVTVIDPASTYIEVEVVIGQDTVVLPGCVLQGRTTIGRNCAIGPYSQVVDSSIGDGCRVTYSVVEEARMEARCDIGPFGHLRKGAHLAEGVHMGNFGEVKNSYLASGVHMGHFSYVGDAQIGENVNIGAGTITCNYDGRIKSRTVVGDNAFIGSDTLLVAPVTVGAGARTGAGSVVTHDVPDGGLVYGVPARAPQAKPAVDSRK